MSRRVHVVQGLSAAGCFKQAIHPSPADVFVNEDVLSLGPLAPFRSIDQWALLRESYWNSVALEEPGRPFNRDLLANAEALRDVDSIVLWLGAGAAEQLLLAWTVQLLKLIGSGAQVHLVQFTREFHVNAWALALLHPEQIRRHPPVEQLSGEDISELERLWQRVISADPAEQFAAISEESVLMQQARASLQPFIYRYPDYRTGLARWDSELLKYAKEKGPRAVRVIGHTMGFNFDADLVSDEYLFSRLRLLSGSALAHPLLTMSGDPRDMRNCEVALTDAGESVLAAQANAVELNGIDDWILGVHLDSKSGPVWYQKEGALVIDSGRPAG
jgi:hypothetical protein